MHSFFQTLRQALEPCHQAMSSLAASALGASFRAAPLLAMSLLAPALALTISGCAAPGGASGLPQGANDPQALEILQSVYQRNQDIPTIALRGEVNYSKGSDRWFFRFELIAEKPGSFLFTVLDPSGSPAFRILSDSRGFRALDYRQRIYYQGAAQERPLEAFLPIPLTTAEFLSLLSGAIPEKPESARPETTMDRDARYAVLVYQTSEYKGPGDWRARLQGGPGYLPEDRPSLSEVSRGPRGNPDFFVRYDDWGSHLREDTGSQVGFPNSLRAYWRGRPGINVRCSYTEVRLGFKAPAGVFSLEQPEGFEMRLV
jgi:hypothetical protein